MHIEKKQIQKEDGRKLIYYHFPETATSEETDAFRTVEAEAMVITTGEKESKDV